MDKKIIGKYKSFLKDNLSKKRYNHCINVANSALILARKYNANEEKCYVAGLLHDVCKEMPIDEQFEFVEKSPLKVSEIEKRSTVLYHGIAGAEFVQIEFGIYDTDIISAIRYHTVACKDMDRVSQIVYLADLISDDRDYKDVKRMRRIAEQSLDKAMLEALKFSIVDTVKKDNTVPLSTLECYNDFAKIKNYR